MLLLEETTQNSRLQPHLRTQMQMQMKMPAIKDPLPAILPNECNSQKNTLARPPPSTQQQQTALAVQAQFYRT